MAKVRNPFNFTLFSKPLGRELKADEVVDTDDETAAAASATGVFQWLDGPDGYDGKVPVFDRDGNALSEEQALGRRGRKITRSAASTVEVATAGDSEER